MSFSSNISKIMADKNMTYEELQYLSKLGPDTIARARDDRISSCKLATLGKIASALNVHVYDLFSYNKTN